MLLIAALLVHPEIAAADEKLSFFPEISRLDYSDLNYRQLQEDIEFFYKSAAGGSSSPDDPAKKRPPLMFYSYKVSTDINIFSIASQAGLPYETIASLNGISSTAVNLFGKILLVPSQPGIYLSAQPETDLEFISRSLESRKDVRGGGNIC